MKESDAIFWDRLAGMPATEAEQECVLRRDTNCLELAMLQGEIAKITDTKGVKATKEAKDIGLVMSGIMAQNTALNERIKYLRKLHDKLAWKHAVRAIYGDEGVEACVVWIQMQENAA